MQRKKWRGERITMGDREKEVLVHNGKEWRRVSTVNKWHVGRVWGERVVTRKAKKARKGSKGKVRKGK